MMIIEQNRNRIFFLSGFFLATEKSQHVLITVPHAGLYALLLSFHHTFFELA